MSAFLQVGFYVLILIIVFLCGLPLTLLIKSKKLKESFIPLTLLLGTSVLIIISFWLSYIGLPFRDSCYLILLLFFIINIIVFYLKRRTCKTGFIEGVLSNHRIILLCIIAGGMALIPIVVYNAEFTYGDTYTYVCISDFLMDNGYRTPIQLNGYKPWLTQMFLYQERDYRIGAQMLLSLFTSIFNREFSLELFAPTSALSIVLCGCSVWFFIQQNYEINRAAKWVGVVLTIFNIPIIVWSSIFGFFPQLFGIIFFICALAMYIKILKEINIGFENILLCGVFIACTSLVYSEIVPFLVLDFIAIFLYMLIKKKRKMIHLFRDTILSGLIAITLLGPYFLGMIKAIISQFGAVVGGEQFINWWSYIGYLLSSVSAGFNYKNLGINILIKIAFSIFTCIMLSLGALGIKSIIKNKKYEIIEEFIVLSLPFMFMLVYFTSFAKNPFGTGIGNSWGLYKLVQYYITIFIPYFSIIISVLFSKKNRAMISLCSLLYILFNIVNLNDYSSNFITSDMRNYTGNLENPIGEYYELYSKYKHENRVINLVGLPIQHRKMVTYMLKNNKLVSDWSSDGYFGIYGSYPDPEYDLNGIILEYDEFSENAIANLSQIDSGIAATASGTGFYSLESDGIDKWQWSQSVSELTITNISNSEIIEISFGAVIANAESKDKILYIYDGDNLFTKKELSGSILTPINIKMKIDKQGQKTLRFIFNGDIKPGDEYDNRDLSFGIWNLKTVPIQ